MPTLSVAMIVKNEEGCLEECLSGIRSIADEIVVADTGSTDNTAAIASRLGARVMALEWRNDFAAARNAVLAAATGDWLLHLDADEVVDPEGARRIRALVDCDGGDVARGRADAIEVTLANYSDDPRAWRWAPVASGDPMARGKAGYIAVGLLRLFRNHRGYHYREAVHESISESVRELGGCVRAEPIVIHHYGYAPTGPGAEAKARLYLAIEQDKVRQRPGDPKAWHDLAEQRLAGGDTLGAEEACRRALALHPLHLGAASTLSNILLNRGALEEAREQLERLHAAGFREPHIGAALGAVACKQGRLDDARTLLETVIAQYPRTLMARFYLARALDRLGKQDATRRQLEAAVALAPSLEEFQNKLKAHDLRREGERLCQTGDPRRALPLLVEALRLDNDDPVTHNDLGVTLSALGQVESARQSFQRALRLAPGMPEALDNLDALPSGGACPSPGSSS